MKEINQIVDQITQAADVDAKEFETSEKTRIDERFSSKMEKLSSESALEFEREKRLLTREFNQKETQAKLGAQNKVLHEKQRLLAELYELSEEKMKNWSADEFHHFFSKALEKANLKGLVKVQLGEFPQVDVSRQWLAQFENENLHFELQEERLAGEGGFVFSQDGIEYNFLFSRLIQEIARTNRLEIIERLFAR